MTALPAEAAAPARATPWGTRLLALLGFLLAIALGGLFLSQQIAVEKARNYARNRFKVNLDVPVHAVRPTLISDDIELTAAPPPLGFCWSIELETGLAAGEVLVNPWTHEVVGWRLQP